MILPINKAINKLKISLPSTDKQCRCVEKSSEVDATISVKLVLHWSEVGHSVDISTKTISAVVHPLYL